MPVYGKEPIIDACACYGSVFAMMWGGLVWVNRGGAQDCKDIGYETIVIVVPHHIL